MMAAPVASSSSHHVVPELVVSSRDRLRFANLLAIDIEGALERRTYLS